MADSRDFPKDWADEMNDEQVSKSRATVSICNRCHHALSQHEFNACYVKGCLCEGLIAAAPAPQAEGTSLDNDNDPEGDGKIAIWRYINNHEDMLFQIFTRLEKLEGAAPAETAGEMTAKQWRVQHGGKGAWAYWNDDRAESFAKQRVEQAERRAVQYGDSDEVEFDTWVRDVESQRPDDHSSMWTAWRDGRALLRAKVADLERERDTLRSVAEENDRDYNVVCDKLAAAESELREMREAAEKLVKRLKLVLSWPDVDAASFSIELGVELEGLEFELARKAGS